MTETPMDELQRLIGLDEPAVEKITRRIREQFLSDHPSISAEGWDHLPYQDRQRSLTMTRRYIDATAEHLGDEGHD